MKEVLRRMYYFSSFKKFKRVGDNVIFSRGGKIMRPEEISIGNNVFINSNFHISARQLSFGNNIMIGPNLVIECDDHIYNMVGKPMFQVQKDRNIGYVKLEDDIWIGATVTILKNVVIGEGSIIGAGSVVTKEIPPYTIAVGNPCKPIKPRFSIDELKKHLLIVKSSKSADEVIARWKLHKIST